MKKVLMVAYHYPPFGGGSGIHRTLKFSRYLSEYGWQPIVLTISPHAYPLREKAQHSVPAGVVTARAFALDTANARAVTTPAGTLCCAFSLRGYACGLIVKTMGCHPYSER